jgi:hypothetical protein
MIMSWAVGITWAVMMSSGSGDSDCATFLQV